MYSLNGQGLNKRSLTPRNSTWILMIMIHWMANPLQGQNPFNAFKIDHWDTKKGLPNDLILNLYQSQDGFLWMTSFAGLTRFDGMNFTTFNSKSVPLMKSDNIEQLYESQDSTLWIPMQKKGLIGYKQGVFKEYLSETSFSRIIGFTPDRELLFLSGNKNNPYFLFNTHSKTKTLLNDSMVLQLAKAGKIGSGRDRDQSGNLWKVTPGRLERIQDGETHILTEKEGIRRGGIFHEIFVDKQNRVWLPSREGLLLWNGKKMEVFPGMENKAFFALSNTRSGLMLEDKNGSIWAAYSGGLAYLPPHGNQFEFLPENHSLQSINITYLLEDKESNIWAASENGIYKLSPSKFKNYSEQEGLTNNRLSAVCALDTHHYLVATSRDGRLFSIYHGKVSPYHYKDPSNRQFTDEIYQIFKDSEGNIWVCGQRQTIKISGRTEKRVILNSAVRSVFEDKDKKIWFGLPLRGIGFLNEKEELELADFPEVDFKSLFITSIRKLNNDHWMVTTGNKGVLLIDPQGKPTMYNDTAGLPTNVIYNTYEEPDSTIWMTTNRGLFRFKGGNFSGIKFKEGLPESALFQFLPDQLGNVWFPFNWGVVRVQKQDLRDYLDGEINAVNWRIYDDGDGMRNRQCTGARFSDITQDGKLLIPTMGGLVEIDPRNLIQNTTPPPVSIHRVLFDGKGVDLTQINKFSPGNHRYLFEFSGLSLVAPEKVQFKFRLIGYDKDWVASTADRRAFYTNLPSGSYGFQVVASNNDGVWNEKGATVEFTVLPFYYETTWFWILAVLTLIMLVWLVVYWRTRATRKQNELLEAQVASRTQDLNRVNGDLNQTNAAIATQRDKLEHTLMELKAAQAQLIQSEKMASLGELTAGIAHEIQNPLNFVNNFSEVNSELIVEMKQAIEKGNMEQIKAIANVLDGNEQKIIHHGKRADAIVKSMLQHSKRSDSTGGGIGKIEPTDINALVDEYLRLAYHGLRAKDKSFNATLITDFDDSIGLINVIPQDIGRAILNLISNAFYAVGIRSKEITFMAVERSKQINLPATEKKKPGDDDYEPTVLVSTKKINGKIEIKVKDNGNGIPLKVLDKIFQPFFTTKPTGEGTGLGLSMAYDIITKGHGGDIRVKSQEGVGTEFEIFLPINSQPQKVELLNC